MKKLTAYLARLFVTDAAILFGILCFLLWLVNCLRSFDVVSAKGQGFVTLAIQALYTMPPLALSFFYICIAVGMARALTALQASHELHIIHSGRGLGGLWRASSVTIGLSVVAVSFLAHVVEPMANRQLNALNEAVAADLVSSSLRPGRFTQVTPGVVLLIGGREEGGLITEFFADDRRDSETRRTYIAQAARVLANGNDYLLQLSNGALQYTGADGRYSEVRFASYDISVDSLSQSAISFDALAERDSFRLITDALRNGEFDSRTIRHLLNRGAEALRVIGMCLLVLAVAGFPSGNRMRTKLPLEPLIVVVAFLERGISAYSTLGSGTGAVLLIVIAVALMAYRLWPRRIGVGVAA